MPPATVVVPAKASVPSSTSVPVPVSARPPPPSVESIVAVPDSTLIVPPQEGSESVPPLIVALPSMVIAPTFTSAGNIDGRSRRP